MVALGWDHSAAHVFDKASGKRIALSPAVAEAQRLQRTAPA